MLVFGDVMVDRYIPVEADGVSAEWPMPRFRETPCQSHYVPGGAANVAVNVAALGQPVTLLGVASSQVVGNRLVQLLQPVTGLTTEWWWPRGYDVPLKTRYTADGRQVFRVDTEQPTPAIPDAVAALTALLHRLQPPLVVVSDYAKGLLTEDTADALVTYCTNARIPLLVDTKPQHVEWFRGATAITPNKAEYDAIVAEMGTTSQDFDTQATELLQHLQLDWLLSTRGIDGAVLATRSPHSRVLSSWVRTQRQPVCDVAGAGDTFIAAMAVALCRRTPLLDAVRFANKAAGIAVAKSGTSTVTLAEMEPAAGTESKLQTADDLVAFAEQQRRLGLPVVVTNGCFDVLHPGHVATLEFAASYGPVIALVNTDESVRRIKGATRPLQSQDWRARGVAATAAVAAVALFDADTPDAMIKRLSPDVLVKGGTTDPDTIPGADFVRSYGGIVACAPEVPAVSTSAFAATLKD